MTSAPSEEAMRMARTYLLGIVNEGFTDADQRKLAALIDSSRKDGLRRAAEMCEELERSTRAAISDERTEEARTSLSSRAQAYYIASQAIRTEAGDTP